MLFSLLCCLLYSSLGNLWAVFLLLYDCTSDLSFCHLFCVHSQMGCISLQVFVMFFILVSCCLFCLGIILSFLLVHWYFLSFSPTLHMIVFHCSYLFFLACCCLFNEFIVSSSFCHSSFIVAFGNFISLRFGMLFAFLFGCALVFLICPLVFLCLPNFM